MRGHVESAHPTHKIKCCTHTQWDLLWPWFRHGPTPIRVPACGCQHVSTEACMRPDAYETCRKSHYSIGFKARYREAHTIGTQIQSQRCANLKSISPLLKRSSGLRCRWACRPFRPWQSQLGIASCKLRCSVCLALETCLCMCVAPLCAL